MANTFTLFTIPWPLSCKVFAAIDECKRLNPPPPPPPQPPKKLSNNY